MIVRFGLLALLVASAVAPAAAGVPGDAVPVDGEVARPESPHSAALLPMSGVVLVGAVEEASPAQGVAGAGRRNETPPRRAVRTAGVWTLTRPDVGACARKRVLRL